MLEKEGRSMSEFLAEAAANYVEARDREPEEIVLEGYSGKKIFKGHELYRREDSDSETGVFLTAKGNIVYWSLLPRAVHEEDQEKFEVYDNLEQLWEQQGWIKPHMRSKIQREYATLTNQPIVERLDI
jgi:hypothetical protein